MAIIRYIRENLKIEIWIAKGDIDSTDVCLLYETTGDDTLIATLKSRETDDDPSFGDSYLFVHEKIIPSPDTYTFRFTTRDLAGNESDTVGTMEHIVCNVPVDPDPIPWEELSQNKNSSGAVDLSSNEIVHYKMNDALATSNVVDDESNSDGTFSGANTVDRSVTGKINTALNFIKSSDDYIDTNDTFQTEFRSSFSINLWIKPNDAQPGVVRYFWGVTDGGANQVVLIYDINGIWLSYRANTQSPSIASYIATNPMVNNQWHMVTLTLEEVDTNTIKGTVYVDTVNVGDSGNVAHDMDVYASVQNLYIGAINSAGVDKFHHDGPIDDFRFFDKVLTTADMYYLYNAFEGTEDSANDLSSTFQTVFHQPIDNPSFIVEDGDYDIDDTNIGVEDLRPEEYLYFRTYSNTCGSRSNESTTTSNLNLPTSDADKLFIQSEALGTFSLRWGYSALSNDPITHFNIYYMIIVNPSLEEDTNPSFVSWVLDGTVNYSSMINNFSFISTTQFAEGTIVEWKVNPVSISGERDDSGTTITGDPDFDAPVVNNFLTKTTLL